VDELSPNQQEAVDELTQSLDGLASALVKCRENGLEPADAFVAAGIDIPPFAHPMLNMVLQTENEQMQQV
jgi:hypothetical protein